MGTVESSGPRWLSARDILSTNDREVFEVEVPEWGGVVGLRSISGSQRERFGREYTRYAEGKSDTDLRVMLLGFALCDRNGESLMSAEELEALGDKNHAVLDRLFKQALEVSGIDAGAEEAAKNA